MFSTLIDFWIFNSIHIVGILFVMLDNLTEKFQRQRKEKVKKPFRGKMNYRFFIFTVLNKV
jgi:hypothetical protein